MMCADRRGGRVVECSGLENRRGFASSVGSNPTLSAKSEKPCNFNKLRGFLFSGL